MTQTTQSADVIKFLYSYGGRITPRRSDGKLRYIGGHTRVLSVPRATTLKELMSRLGEACGESMSLRCKVPTEDLDVLVSVKSDEDLRNVVEEYEGVESKIVAILYPNDPVKRGTSPPSSPMSCFDFPAAVTPESKARFRFAAANRFYSVPVGRNWDSRGLKHFDCHYQLSKNLQGQFRQ